MSFQLASMQKGIRFNDSQLLYLAGKAKQENTICGFLYKKSSDLGKWQMRWFLLYQNLLMYFESDTASRPSGVALLEGSYCDRAITPAVIKGREAEKQANPYILMPTPVSSGQPLYPQANPCILRPTPISSGQPLYPQANPYILRPTPISSGQPLYPQANPYILRPTPISSGQPLYPQANPCILRPTPISSGQPLYPQANPYILRPTPISSGQPLYPQANPYVLRPTPISSGQPLYPQVNPYSGRVMDGSAWGTTASLSTYQGRIIGLKKTNGIGLRDRELDGVPTDRGGGLWLTNRRSSHRQPAC
ncbi:hypothetical protein ACOMHN_003347 [Nucella lapillus]